jgi:hypothetical protein
MPLEKLSSFFSSFPASPGSAAARAAWPRIRCGSQAA